MIKKLSIPQLAFLQASGLVMYLILVSCFFAFVTPLFRDTNESFVAPIIMLLLFIVSAVISASLVLGRAAVLFFEKQYHQSFLTILWTVIWCVLYFVLLILVFVLI